MLIDLLQLFNYANIHKLNSIKKYSIDSNAPYYWTSMDPRLNNDGNNTMTSDADCNYGTDLNCWLPLNYSACSRRSANTLLRGPTRQPPLLYLVVTRRKLKPLVQQCSRTPRRDAPPTAGAATPYWCYRVLFLMVLGIKVYFEHILFQHTRLSIMVLYIVLRWNGLGS